MFRKPSTTIAFLAALNFLNYLDRYIVAAVGPSMQRDLHLTDSAFGAIGSAFLWGYVLTSPFFGRLMARYSRKILIAVGVLVWSAATAASGFIGVIAVLLAVRFLVGAGSSDFVALSPTILDEVADDKCKGRVLAIFYAAVPIGSAFGFIYGGLMEKYFGWSSAFLTAGLLGILLVPLCFFLQDAKQKTVTDHSTLKTDLVGIRSSRRYMWTVIGYAAQTFALGGFAFWAPTFLERKFAYPMLTGNLIFGGIVVATGFIGTLAGGWIADRMKGNDRVKNALLLSVIATAIVIPFAFVAVLTASPMIFFLSMAVVQLALFATFSPVNTIFLGSVPKAVRATAMGVSVFIGRLLGDMISIWLVGVLSDAWHSLTVAMLVIPCVLFLNLLFWAIALRQPALDSLAAPATI